MQCLKLNPAFEASLKSTAVKHKQLVTHRAESWRGQGLYDIKKILHTCFSRIFANFSFFFFKEHDFLSFVLCSVLYLLEWLQSFCMFLTISMHYHVRTAFWKISFAEDDNDSYALYEEDSVYCSALSLLTCWQLPDSVQQGSKVQGRKTTQIYIEQ